MDMGRHLLPYVLDIFHVDTKNLLLALRVCRATRVNWSSVYNSLLEALSNTSCFAMAVSLEETRWPELMTYMLRRELDKTDMWASSVTMLLGIAAKCGLEMLTIAEDCVGDRSVVIPVDFMLHTACTNRDVPMLEYLIGSGYLDDQGCTYKWQHGILCNNPWCRIVPRWSDFGHMLSDRVSTGCVTCVRELTEKFPDEVVNWATPDTLVPLPDNLEAYGLVLRLVMKRHVEEGRISAESVDSARRFILEAIRHLSRQCSETQWQLRHVYLLAEQERILSSRASDASLHYRPVKKDVLELLDFCCCCDRTKAGRARAASLLANAQLLETNTHSLDVWDLIDNCSVFKTLYDLGLVSKHVDPPPASYRELTGDGAGSLLYLFTCDTVLFDTLSELMIERCPISDMRNDTAGSMCMKYLVLSKIAQGVE